MTTSLLKVPPYQWVGSKFEFMDQICPVFNRLPHDTYVSWFFGAGSDIFRKEKSPVEVVNDCDGDITNFFRVCRDHKQELAEAVALTPYHAGEWQRAKAALAKGEWIEPIERARLFLMVARMSHGGRFGDAFSRVIAHSRRGMASSCSRWLHSPATIYAVADRMLTVQIEEEDACGPALRERYDRKGTLHYLDPTYMVEDEGKKLRSKKLYRHEMSREDHERMLSEAVQCKGAVVISGYDNSLYNKVLKGWEKKKFTVSCRSNNNSKGGKSTRPTREEVLWIKEPG